ncbi:hypothetical protein [Novacetimonas cocois]|uniref:hypothetical protein n=1 Tax=Novacetimonas cocois TaxID=1747507 RepID=UPI0010582E96|nr:hypothetical protein [Novacetimonas cocois]
MFHDLVPPWVVATFEKTGLSPWHAACRHGEMGAARVCQQGMTGKRCVDVSMYVKKILVESATNNNCAKNLKFAYILMFF